MVSIPVCSEPGVNGQYLHVLKTNVQYCFYTHMWSTEIQCMSLNVDFIFKAYHGFDRYNVQH